MKSIKKQTESTDKKRKNEKLHILVVNKFYFPHIGGVEDIAKNHSEYFESRNDIEVKVLCCRKRGKAVQCTVNGVSVYKAASLGVFFSCPLSFVFFRKFRELSSWADIIEFHMPFPLGDIACLLSGFRGKAVLAWHSDVVKQKKLMHFYEPFLKRFLDRADMIITATKNHISSSSYLCSAAEKCRVAAYGIDIKKYLSVKREPYFAEKMTNKNHKKIFFTGRLVYYKGVDVLLDAMKYISEKKKDSMDMELFIAGTGPLEEGLRQKAALYKIDGCVHFLGRLPGDELKLAFADCDLFVLPSVEVSEAFGLVQLEAMVYGKPVINTALPTGVPLVSLDGETGFTAKVGDSADLAEKMMKIFDDEYYGKFSENSQKRVIEEFSLEKSNEQLQKCIDELLGRRESI